MTPKQYLMPAALSVLVFTGCAPAQTETMSEPESVSETPAAEMTAAPRNNADYSLFAGTWHTENNLREITVYDTGGFALKDGTVLYEGELAEDPAHPGSFMLYLENNTRWGNNALLSADPAHPGTLTLQEGMGADLFVPGARETEDESAPPFKLTLLDTIPDTGRVYHFEESDTPSVFSVCAADRLNDFRILGLRYEGSDEEGKPGFVTWELFYQEVMIPEEEITVIADVSGTMPNVGISYDDASGDSHYWYLTLSGYDGSLEVIPFWD